MSDIQLLICSFAGERAADAAAAAIQSLDRRSDAVDVSNLAVLRKAASGEVSIWEGSEEVESETVTQLSIAAGWLLGALGALVGAPLGPSFGIRGGEVAGTSAAAQIDSGFPDSELRRLAAQLQPDTSVLLAVTPASQAAAVLAELEQLGGTPLHITPPPALMEKLRGR